MKVTNTNYRVCIWAFRLCGIWLIGMGVYFIFVRPPLLPEDARFIGVDIELIRRVLPGLEAWLRHVFTVMGGFMMGMGFLMFSFLSSDKPPRKRESLYLLGLTGAISVGTMSWVNFALDSAFKWVLLLPVLFWLVGLIGCIGLQRQQKSLANGPLL